MAGTAAAETQPAHVELVISEDWKVGQETTVQAMLSQGDGTPIGGGKVTFGATAEFANVKGEIELGQAVTNDQGVATLAYLPRSSGAQTVIARFQGDDRYGPAESSRPVSVETGPQLHHEEAGVSVPGIGVWLVSAGLAVVWIAFLFVTALLWLIAGMKLPGLPYRS
jgi:hypothetical protein